MLQGEALAAAGHDASLTAQIVTWLARFVSIAWFAACVNFRTSNMAAEVKV